MIQAVFSFLQSVDYRVSFQSESQAHRLGLAEGTGRFIVSDGDVAVGTIVLEDGLLGHHFVFDLATKSGLRPDSSKIAASSPATER